MYADNSACTKWDNSFIWGRERAKHIDNRKDFAHKVIQKGTMCPVKVLTLAQLADILTKRLHPQHYHVSGRQSKEREDLDPSGDLIKRGWVAKAIKLRHVGPYEGSITDLGSLWPELDIGLNPSRPSPGSRRLEPGGKPVD